jgi:hypothetical protein
VSGTETVFLPTPNFLLSCTECMKDAILLREEDDYSQREICNNACTPLKKRAVVRILTVRLL